VVAAAMQFDARLAAMPEYYRRTLDLYEALRAWPQLKPNPARPQANMLHVHMPVSCERALALRDQVAQQHGVWLYNRVAHAALPDHCYTELYVGDNLLAVPAQRLPEILGLWSAALLN
jgi:threonine aldolase